MRPKSRSRWTTWPMSTTSWKPCRRSALWPELRGICFSQRICQLPEMITFYWMTFRGNQNHQTLVVMSLGRPGVQTQILQLCAGCTKTDVALNNLVVRARIGFIKKLCINIALVHVSYRNLIPSNLPRTQAHWAQDHERSGIFQSFQVYARSPEAQSSFEEEVKSRVD